MNASRSIGNCVLAGTLVLLGHAPARADQPLWELGLGAGWLQLPHYRGSDQNHQWLLPVPYAVYRGQIFRATRDGARAVLLDSERMDVDISASLSAPTRSAGNRAREGMPDLAPTLELGPNLNINLGKGAWRGGALQGTPWKLDLRLPVYAVTTLQDGARGIGFSANAIINLDVRWQGWNVGAQAAALYGSRRYHQYFYDVAAPFATATRPAYAAEAGFGGMRYTLGTSKRIGNTWLGAFVRADSLSGARFVGSPLVRQRHTVSAGLALSWVLATSDERVAVDD
jgi:outer membrane scaffolding protein for murein synthesis (MipA/OmpV family)